MTTTYSDCLFCRLVAGELPRHQVYEDDDFLVLLTIEPVNPGHLMVVPKAHIGSFYDVDDALYTPLMLLVKRMAQAVKEAMRPLQVVMETSGIGNRHVHIHVIPVHDMYDVIPKEVIERLEANRPSDEELSAVARTLTGYISDGTPRDTA